MANDDQKHQNARSEDDTTGEQSISGSTPDLEADDDTLKTAQDTGLYESQDEEHPGELNIAGEVEKDEKQNWQD